MRQQNALMFSGQNISSLSHKVNPAKNQIFFILDLCRFPGQFEGITTKVCEPVDIILLVMMAENE